MRIEKKKKNKFLQKELVRLNANPFNSNKFLKLTLETIEKNIYSRDSRGMPVVKTIFIKRFIEKKKTKKEKWRYFLQLLEKSNKFYNKYKPYTFNHHKVSVFASPGNSFKKQFRKDLLTKKFFSYFYGRLQRKPLKKKMTQIYKIKQVRNSYRTLCTEYFESRLDAVLKKTYFCSTIKEAKQTIVHKHILVNDKIETNYSHILKQGDLIVISPKSRQMVKRQIRNYFKKCAHKIIWPISPSYLSINYNTLEVIFGKVRKFNFSNSYSFKNENERVVESYYRH